MPGTCTLLERSGKDLGWERIAIGEYRTSTRITRYMLLALTIGSVDRIYNVVQFSQTYPALLAVPATISDNVLNYAGRYRSRARIPTLTYLHPVNDCSITRSSQPLAGFRGNRSIQDEKLVGAIFATTQNDQTSFRLARTNDGLNGSQESEKSTAGGPQASEGGVEIMEDELIAATSGDLPQKDKVIYGAQQHNLIVDARPTVNAMAMQAVGLGSENMDHYKFATKVYLGIDNIHVMRDSLAKVVEAIKDSDITPLLPNRELLAKSGWLKHISGLLDGAALIARQVGIQHSHVLIHCSDGWDRTSQLSALSQICLDPYYRTLDGFIVLVEKDWLSYGHMFRHRCGFLNSERWFVTQNEGLGGGGGAGGSIGLSHSTSGSSALENALLTAKGFFNKENSSRESLPDSDGEMITYQQATAEATSSPSGRAAPSAAKETTKVKETSPVFHQFLDATYQLLRQHPSRFEFNERFLRRLLYHLYSCQYGTFLYDSEKARADARVQERTRSVWDYFLARRDQFVNKEYTGCTIDERERDRERLIFPRPAEVRWWNELFNRSDEEMNGPGIVSAGEGSVLTGIESSQSTLAAAAAAVGDDRRPSNPSGGRVSPRLSPLRGGYSTSGHSTTGHSTGAGAGAGAGIGAGVGIALSTPVQGLTATMAKLSMGIGGVVAAENGNHASTSSTGKAPMGLEMQ